MSPNARNSTNITFIYDWFLAFRTLSLWPQHFHLIAQTKAFSPMIQTALNSGFVKRTVATLNCTNAPLVTSSTMLKDVAWRPTKSSAIKKWTCLCYVPNRLIPMCSEWTNWHPFSADIRDCKTYHVIKYNGLWPKVKEKGSTIHHTNAYPIRHGFQASLPKTFLLMHSNVYFALSACS